MRRVKRVPLSKQSEGYLNRKQAEVDAGNDVHVTWKAARHTKTMSHVMITLCTMAGKRARCMFCQDSRGTDIDHFWPKATYKNRAFLWENLLLACAGCNRQKGNQFPLDSNGVPLLIDPTTEHPWRHLFYDSHTGNVTARIDPTTGIPDPKGCATTNPRVLPLNIDPVAEGRQRTDRNLRHAVRDFLTAAPTRSGADRQVLLGELLGRVRDHDDYGLVSWYVETTAATEEPFHTLHTQHQDAWQRLQDYLAENP